MLKFSKPAQLLTGRELEDGWRVIGPVTRPENATGGTFSTPYIVEKDGKRAFLKAMDLSKGECLNFRVRGARRLNGMDAPFLRRPPAAKVQAGDLALRDGGS